ncbi:hypothetical protein [Spongiactinospora rosea]|uniref:hypothetical protein n=1 Tax=Spongiactinospora rosea TaxID=2248750 RepID=UPI001CEC053A|nr:hypothetical protein [Spongiactinospora rosea]
MSDPLLVRTGVYHAPRMYAITLTEHPAPGFRGTPTGVDVALVMRTGLPGRDAGVGQVGAGLAVPPVSAFTTASAALAEAVPPSGSAATWAYPRHPSSTDI